MNIFIAVLLSFLSLNANKKADFKLVSATSQQWTAGRAEGGRGINYELTLVAQQKSKKITIKKLWIGEEAFEVKVMKMNSKLENEKYPANYRIKAKSFAPGDTLYVTAMKMTKRSMHGKQAEDKLVKKGKAPIKLQGEAALEYKYKKKTRFLQIEKFKVLKPLMYP